MTRTDQFTAPSPRTASSSRARASAPLGFPGRAALRRRYRALGGFSLLELMVTTAIIAVGMTLATNAFSNYSRRQAHQADVQEITRLLYRVRQRSILLGQFNTISIAGDMIDHSMSYSDMNAGEAGFGIAELADGIKIYSLQMNDDPMLTLVYTNQGRLLSGTSQFRICTDNITGERSIVFTISSSGQLTTERGVGLACS